MSRLMKSDTKNNGKFRNSKFRLSIERMLFLMFIATFSLLVIVQAAMTNPSVRTFLTAESEFEGTPMEVEEFFYKEGSISLKLMDLDNDPDIRIMVNGDAIAVFSENVVEISVKDGDIVEIDASSSFNESGVEVTAKSDNIITDCIGKKVTVKSNIKKVMDVKVE